MASMAFDAREASIASIHHALSSHTATIYAIVQAHLARIAVFNPAVNALISLSPDSLSEAGALDRRLERGDVSPATHPLLGIPVLLKDNFDAAGSPTTGGCLALRDSIPTEDAPVVKALRDAGAIILGKANMHELALEGLSVSSLGGQTRNPFDQKRTPGGSSGGSAAAVALSFAVLATGTDTMNSLRNPASANSLFSVRPTRGLVDRTGIIPISTIQDAAGPMGRCVEDVATMLQVMKDVPCDPQDSATAPAPDGVRAINYLDGIREGSLQGKRFGVLRGFFDRTESEETRPVNAAMHRMIGDLASFGIEMIDIDDEVYDASRILRELDTQAYLYRQEMNSYLQRPQLGGRHPTTLDEIHAGRDFLVIPSQYEFVKRSLLSSSSKAGFDTILEAVEELKDSVAKTLRSHQLDALIYPQQKHLVVKVGARSQSGRNGILGALTGFPVIAIPAGFSDPSADAPESVPIGMEMLGRPWTEAELLQMAWQIEQATQVRRPPRLGNDFVPGSAVHSVPFLWPRSDDIGPEYPLGTL